MAADPQVASFSDSPDPVAAGGVVTYSIRVDNNALDAATNTVLTVGIPAGATFLSAGPAGANCAFSAGNVTCNLGTVVGSGQGPRDVQIQVRALGPGPSSLTLNAVVSADNDTNPDPSNNSQSQTTTVIDGADLALTKSGSPNPVVGGANVTYTLTGSNLGPNASANITITDDLPPSTVFVSAGGSGWTCGNSGSTVTCTHAGPHASGASIPAVTVVAQVTSTGGTITNSATITPSAGGTPDPVGSNNTASVVTNVTPGADVRIDQKTVTSANPAIAGQNVTFQIQPRNGGPAVATSAVVTDVLPAGWTYVSASGPNWSCGASGQTVTCTRASFPTSATDNLTVVATPPNTAAVGSLGTTYTNTATISSAVTDPNGGNNSGSVAILVLPDGADLRISKTKTPNPVAQGSPLVSTIVVTNGGPRAATGVLRVVELLAGETYISSSGGGWSCSLVVNTLTCDNTNVGGLPVGASLPALILNTTATSSGALVNAACTGSSVPAGSGGTAQPPIEGDGNTTNDCTSASSNSTVIRPDLSITKVTSTPTGGDKVVSVSENSVTYTLVVTNSSPGADSATGTQIADTVPAFINGRTPAPVVGVVTSGGSTATFSCSTSGATVNCNQSGGQLAQGETATVTITVSRPMQDGTGFVNTATVTNVNEGDPVPGNNSASDTVDIAPIADVQATGKTVLPNPTPAGTQTTYVLSFRNNGPSPAHGVTVSDTFTFPGGDNGLTVVSITPTKGGMTCSIAAGAVMNGGAPSFTCDTNGNDVANNETFQVNLVVRPNFQPGNASRTFTNIASITTTSQESPSGSDNGNNTASASLTVQPAALDLLVNKTDLVDPIGYTIGSTYIDYRVRVTNNGPSLGTNVHINETATPPAGKRIQFICDTSGYGNGVCNGVSLCSVPSAPGAGVPVTFNCQVPAGNGTTGIPQGDLFSGQSKDVYLRFQVLDTPAGTGDSFSNSVTVVANEPDTFAGNDTTVEPTTVRPRLDLSVTKSPSLATVTLNQPFNWNVAVSNAGPGNSLQTDLTDTLPAGLQVTGAITFSKTSPVGSGTCTLSGATISCSLGQLDASGVASIVIPSRVTTYPAGGTLNNTAVVDTDPAKVGGLDGNSGNNTATSTVNVTKSSLAGNVFRDRDFNGQPGGAGENGIASVTLSVSGTDAYGNAVSGSAVTDGSGNYVLDNLPPSNGSGYTITETQPAAYIDGVNPTGGSFDSLGGTRPASGVGFGTVISAIPVGGAVAGTGYNFAEVQRPSVSGTVYRDNNDNGVINAGETGISGATVQLLRASDNALIATTTTDGSGNYNFPTLAPGIYYVQELQPVGFLDGRETAGQLGGVACVACTTETTYVASNEAATTDRIRGLDLTNGDNATAMNFGELAPSSLAGSVFIDFNVNGVRDAPDPALSAVAIALSGNDDRGNAVSRTTVTDGSGNYSFTTLRPAGVGGYTITETQPAGFDNGPNPPGAPADSLGGTRPASGAPGFGIVINAIPVGIAASGTGYVFPETGGTLIAGTVWIDRNRDGVIQSNEPNRAAGATVRLIDPVSGTVISTVTTDVNGNYVFTNAPLGNYRVVLTTPTGYGNTTPTTLNVVVPLAGLTNVNFGLAAGSIAGLVFLDPNNNGTQQGGEAGIAGATIELLNAGGGTVIATTTTDTDGNYRFDDLIAANYTVREPTQPAGTQNGITTAGSTGGTATAVASTPSIISNVVLPAAAASINNNFGELPGASINGNVYSDGNNNGLRDVGETGFAGVSLVLTGTNDLGQTVNANVTSAADGTYVFPTLRPGTYTVTEPNQPPASFPGLTTAGSTGGTATPLTTLPSAIAGITLGIGVSSTSNNFGELGDAPNLVATKQAIGGFATSNDALYRISVANIGQLSSVGAYTVQDRLPNGVTLAGTPTGANWTCVGARGQSSFSCTSSQVIAAGGVSPATIDAPVSVAATATNGSVSAVLNNAVIIDGGGELPTYGPSPTELANFATNPAALPVCAATNAISQNACRTPTTIVQSASVSGTVWFDSGTISRQLDSGDQRLAGWTVEIIDADSGTGAVVRRVTTSADGSWSASDLLPNRNYLIRFRDPIGGVIWGTPVSGNNGTPPVPCVTTNPGAAARSSCVETTDNTQLHIVLLPGDALVQQSLPVDPGGVVYDAITRQPIAGAAVTLTPVGTCTGYNPANNIANAQLGGYTIAGSAITMTVGDQGAYQFLFTSTAPASCQFQLTVQPPASHTFPSLLLPPPTSSFSLPPAPGAFDVQPQASAPAVGQSTTYYLTFSAGSGTQSLTHDHIPLDPRALTGIVITKVGSTQIVELGDSLQYTIRIRNTTALALGSLYVQDNLPAGFRYIVGTARVERVGARVVIPDPVGAPGPALLFTIGPVPANGEVSLTYRVRVGVGAQQGDGINRAQAKPTPNASCSSQPVQCSNVALFRVRVTGGVFTDDTCVAGKVFVDCNNNHIQDDEEPGIPGVRLYLQNGTNFTTDSEGKYSYCGLPPKLHVLKLDPRTMPRGSRLTESSNRNAGDPGSLFLDLKKGELHRADFIEGSCSNTVMEQVKARRAHGETSTTQTEKAGAPLQFRSKPPSAPTGATDSANQPVPSIRKEGGDAR